MIAVALYPEIHRTEPPIPLSRTVPSYPRGCEGKTAGSADKAEAAPAAREDSGKMMKEKDARSEQALESAGTGYGRGEYSPSQVVAFEPEKQALETIYLKYEWRSTLCKLGVIECAQPLRRPANRFWDNGGYAPPPPLSMRSDRP